MSFQGYPNYTDCTAEWLTTVPGHWSTPRLRDLARPGPDNFTDGDWIESPYIMDAGVRLLQTGNIGVGTYREQGFRYVSDDTFSRFKCTEVDPGDVLICRLAEPVGRACLAPTLECKMITSVDVCILKPDSSVNPKFIVYALSSAGYLGFMKSVCRGGTRDRVSRSFLGAVRIPLPPAEEQGAIVAFLDKEVTNIDELIAEQQRLIGLLTEKRQAVISHAVTKGLKPDAPMKPSGVEWLGDVPEAWEIRRLADLFTEVAQAGSEDLPILSVSIHHGVSDDEMDETELDRKVARSEDRSKYKQVAPNDLVYNMMRAWQGGFGTVRVRGMVSPAYVVARPRRDFDTTYIENLLRTPQAVEEMRRHSRGVTDFRLRLYWDEFKTIRVPLPPKPELVAICGEIAAVDDRFTDLISTSECSIELLQERRTALISAAVTGQIDVRGLAAVEVA